MYLSKFFLPIRKDISAEITLASHRLMLKLGMIKQIAGGLYAWLPLGLRVLRKFEAVIREELDAEGFNELLMPTIQPASLWRESGRYEVYGEEMLKMKDRHGNDFLYGPTAEEVLTFIAKGELKSYKDLPCVLYNIQWKFRDEIRPRFGLMRGREFLMMDSYSFDLTQEDARKTYNKHYDAYLRIFARLGLVAIPMQADTGEIGGDLSHEFHIIADSGESEIVYDKKLEELIEDVKNGKVTENLREKLEHIYCATYEQHAKNSKNDNKYYEVENLGTEIIGTIDINGQNIDLKPKQKIKISSETQQKLESYKSKGIKFTPKILKIDENLNVKRGIEVGHNFYFGDKYSRAIKCEVMGLDGRPFAPLMGSYGIGVGRLVAAFIEANHDENGVIWNKQTAPFAAYFTSLSKNSENAKKIYETFKQNNIEVLFDDSGSSAGEKFARADLLGLPWRIIASDKLEAENLVEIKNRRTGEVKKTSVAEALKLI